MQECFSLKKLKEYLKLCSDEDPATGEERKVWVSSNEGGITPITSIRILNVNNSANILLETTKEMICKNALT